MGLAGETSGEISFCSSSKIQIKLKYNYTEKKLFLILGILLGVKGQSTNSVHVTTSIKIDCNKLTVRIAPIAMVRSAWFSTE